MNKPPTSTRLKELDSNFQHNEGKGDLEWVDAFDERIALQGLGWPLENRAARHFRRLPERLMNGFSDGVRVLSRCPAGVFLSFVSNSPDISVRIVLADCEWVEHMPATGMAGAELYIREGSRWYAAAVAKPSLSEKIFTRSLLENAPPIFRECRLYLPLYKEVTSVEIGFSANTEIRLAPTREATRPIIFYGTSITQGGCANTSGSDYVSQLGRSLDREVVNLGFSGNGRGEPEVAKAISEIDAEACVLDYVANADLDLLKATLPEFVAILRTRNPSVPIILLGNIPCDQSLWDKNCLDTLEEKRDFLMAFYLSCRRNGDPNIHFLDGHGLLPIGQSGVFVDGVHPTSFGFAIMAERIAPQLSRILLWKGIRPMDRKQTP